MDNFQEYRSQLRAYVLQQSTPEEAERLEAELFENDDLFAVLIEIEEDLVQRFAQSQLSRHEDEVFRIALSKSARLRDLLEVRRVVVPDNKRQHRIFPWAIATAAMISAVAFLGLRHFHSPSIHSTISRSSGQNVSTESLEVTAVLVKPGVRGSNQQSTGTVVRITPALKKLVLQLPQQFPHSEHLTAAIRPISDRSVVWRGNVSINPQNEAILIIPNILKEDDYIVTVLSGDDPIADFYFRLKISL
ncbi:MAG TPA: hypothetical protein VG759_26480 [Candidatus Angelobacter sp.]|nr:hypothetical protein [Candidatus Angelobacter sp.]